jgi:hypothetical protein
MNEPGSPDRDAGASGGSHGAGGTPRTDLPPTRLPYDDDYFGTGEEEDVVEEREAGDEADPGERPTHTVAPTDPAIPSP